MAQPHADRNSLLDDLLKSIQSGDRDALAALYHEVSSSVYSFSLSILKNVHDAEDVLQDCFIRIYQSADQYHSTGKPMAWIMTIAKNHCYKLLRQRQKTTDLSLEDWKDDPSLVTYIQSDNKLLLNYCMKLLSDQERQIVVLHAVSGFKHREIASMLGLALPTVLSKYNRAIKKLKNQLEKEDTSHDK